MPLPQKLPNSVKTNQKKGHYAVQCTNRKLIYDLPLVINTNLPPVLHRFQVIADYWSNFRWRQGSA